MNIFTEKSMWRDALAPSADLYAGDPASDVITLREYSHVLFAHQKGAGATGTATLTVESCSDVTPTVATAIAFKARAYAIAAAMGALQSVAAAGLAIAAGVGQIILVEVDVEDLIDGHIGARIVLTEGVDSPVVGSVIACLVGARYPGENKHSGIV